MAEDTNEPMEVRALLVGYGGSGRYSISKRFAYDCYYPDHVTSLLEWFAKTVEANDYHVYPYHVTVLKTGVTDYIKTEVLAAGIFAIVFRVDYRISFTEIQNAYRTITDLRNDQPPVMLIGNACDVEESEREVSKEEAEKLAEEWEINYMEVSAKTGENINAMFDELLASYQIWWSVRQVPKARRYKRKRRCIIV